MRKVFTLGRYRYEKLPVDTHKRVVKPPDTVAVVVTGENETLETVQAAWSYALKYTAKGLDDPDYEAAAAMMIERHPTWELASAEIRKAEYLGSAADNDKPGS